MRSEERGEELVAELTLVRQHLCAAAMMQAVAAGGMACLASRDL